MPENTVFLDATAQFKNAIPGTSRFRRLFPDLPPQGTGVSSDIAIERLTQLGMALIDDVDAAGNQFPEGDHPHVPAGYTYLGQFIDHDLTLDPTRLSPLPIDITQLNNFRSPALDLDCLFGFGAGVNPYLYEDRGAGAIAGRLRNANSFATPPQPQTVAHDLPRLGPDNRIPLIGDARNDENLLVGQLHTAFITFANKVFDDLQAVPSPITDLGPAGASLSERTARIVQWHYQWIILHDFLPRIIDNNILGATIANGPRIFRPQSGDAFMPVEFAGAAYRLGHSMVRSKYHHNQHFRGGSAATLRDLFNFSSSGGSVPVPPIWFINWNRFFEIDPNTAVNKARRLDPYAAEALQNMPGPDGPMSLPVRNLLRGWTWGLPSGQGVAGALGVPALTSGQILADSGGQEYKESEIVERFGLHLDTPLWYYILKESQALNNGETLGPVGSTLIAEVFVGLMLADPTSFLAVQSAWRPTLAPGGNFTMVDLFRYLPPETLDPNGQDTGPLA